MDVKSLQCCKLMKRPEELTQVGHVPGQGFSVESEKVFAELAAQKRQDIDKQLAQDRAGMVGRELDDLTRQLRAEFALLNKIIELREIAQRRSTKQSRKAARAALKEAKKLEKRPKPVKQAKRTKPVTPAPTMPSKWVDKSCWRCRSQFAVHVDWQRPPSLCKACTKDLDETHLPSAPDRSTPFSQVHFVSGGAPGTGKRR